MAIMMKVYSLHIVGLHLMIVGAKCQEDLGECSYDQWGSTVITLYGCSVVRVSAGEADLIWSGLSQDCASGSA